MDTLKKTLNKKIPGWRKEHRQLLTQNGDKTVSRITLAQLFKGLRGVNAVHCDTSFVDPVKGLFIRNIPLMELIKCSAEEIFFLLCTGDLPTEKTRLALQNELQKRSVVPQCVWNILDTLPKDTHPMTMLSIAVLSMRRESVFEKKYLAGMPKDEHWEATLEDALTILGRLPVIAAGIYRRYILNEPLPASRPDLGFSDNFAYLLGVGKYSGAFGEFIRQFVIVHSDHEGANASVLTSRIVNSSLSDLFYSLSGAMNCLAGPLHGLANQESVKFSLQILEKFTGTPKDEDLKAYIEALLQSGKVIPGFGHAVLRDHDPRFQAMFDLAQQICPDDQLFTITEKLSRLVPPLLIKQGKAKNPYPNIDGISGTLLYYFGIRDLRFYTVMFSVAQSLGICAQLILNRAIFSPIFRPKSITTQWLQEYFRTHTDK